MRPPTTARPIIQVTSIAGLAGGQLVDRRISPIFIIFGNMLRLLSLLIALFLFSCSSPTPSGKPVVDSIVGAVKADTPKEQPMARHPVESEDTVLPFAGVWVNEIYLDSIRKNHSPRLSQGVMESCIILPARTLQVTRMIAGFHDGGPAWVVVKRGAYYQFYDEAREIARDSIEPLPANRLRIGHQHFGRLNQPDPNKADLGISIMMGSIRYVIPMH